MDIQQIRKKRLRALIASQYRNAADFCRDTGVDSSYLSQILNGHRGFGEKAARTMEQKIGLPAMYLDFEGEGNVVPTDNPTTAVPLISWAAASEFCESPDNFEPGDAEAWLNTPFKHGPRSFCLKVSGPSMLPEYRDGEIILVDPDVEPRHNSDVVVRTPAPDSRHTFKRLQIDQDRAYLVALNKEMPNRILEMPEDTVICGVVVGSWIDRV